jgi:hypothetical protein
MIVCLLVSLSECVMIDVAVSVITETTEIALRTLLFLNGYRYNFNLSI